MSPHCSMFECRNNSFRQRQLSYFTFPRREPARSVWIHRCDRPDVGGCAWKPSPKSVICSEHFTRNDLERDLKCELLNLSHAAGRRRQKRLKPAAIPSAKLHRHHPPITVVIPRPAAEMLPHTRCPKSVFLDAPEDVERRPFVDFVIDEGSTVIVSLGRDDVLPLTISPGTVTQTRYGALNHADLLGVRFGSRVNLARGFVHVLPLTPELWTLALPHRTQVLYAPDISLIVTMLDLAPGHIVAEAGTGSGSLTHALARAVYPCGRVYTFDFHEERVRRAADEFKRHHLSNIVICQQRDVVGHGFGLLAIAQAAILDLPNPWEVVPKLVTSLRHSGARVCFFSPCIEQVQRTCAALDQTACFSSISTLEVSRRRMELCRSRMPVANVGQTSAKHFLDVMKAKAKVEETFSDCAVDCELVEDPQRCQKEHRCAAFNGQDTPETLVADVVQPSRFTGHTGYLTFATYVPDLA